MASEDMLKRTEIYRIFKDIEEYDNKLVKVCGWVKTIRANKNLGFIELNDGSMQKNIQIVLEAEAIDNFAEVTKENVGAALTVVGVLKETKNAKQPCEIKASKVIVEGHSSEAYPLQKKHHSLEFLRTIPQLRARTNTLSAVFRVRSTAAYAIHKFFNKRGFVYVHTPILTGSDCEGAGEMFRVTSLDLDNLPLNENNKVDYSKDMFGKPANLTVSGQLEGECMAMAFGKIYTFGPTFRAENSNTAKHAAEFWMIEPEIAFADLDDDMELAEDMLKYVIKYVLKHCSQELEFLNEFIDKNLIERLKFVLESDVERVTYTEAVELLKKSGHEFNYPVGWGCDLQTEHERYLTEQVFKKPIFVTHYPKEIKSFYMKLDSDGKTVAAMDMLVPGIGEIIGGSQREENLEVLERRIDECGLKKADYEWYLDLRRFGSAKHAGFGLGFERLIMYLTGIPNIRDVLLFPRTAGSMV